MAMRSFRVAVSTPERSGMSKALITSAQLMEVDYVHLSGTDNALKQNTHKATYCPNEWTHITQDRTVCRKARQDDHVLNYARILRRIRFWDAEAMH
jgi:hypothetical protein